ncbi:MAG: hypothetical protein GF383_12465 [Candidatus Lokiarchaeota archaeon]|nr:hypothetical protein [Candidatus Lokiarchaeota archaeon]
MCSNLERLCKRDLFLAILSTIGCGNKKFTREINMESALALLNNFRVSQE